MAKKIGKGKALEELVKGSMDYTMQLIRDAFRKAFPYAENGPSYYVNETFADHVIVSSFDDAELKTDEYFMVSFTRNGDEFTFAARMDWQVVELTYQPQSAPSLAEAKKDKKRSTRFDERVDAVVQLEEATEEGKGRRIKIQGAMTANIINGNGRRYPAHVIESAVAELRSHLNESAGQGRAVQVLGEAEHPSDKGGRPNLLETVVKWQDVTFDGARVDVTGSILETSKGKDILTLMEGGVMPGVSLRGYGDGKKKQDVFEVSELHITGFDLVLEPSFKNVAEFAESTNQNLGDDEMLEELKKLLAEHPELFSKGMTEAQLEALGEKQLTKLTESMRNELGIGKDANILEAVKLNADKARKFDESQKQNEVKAAIEEATKDLPFGEKMNKVFVESFNGQKFADAEAVKSYAEAQRKQFGTLAAAGLLAGIGFDEKTKKIQVIGDVLESETGTPNFAKVSFELTESLRKKELRPAGDMRKREDRASIFTVQLLEKFDKMYQHKMLEETKQFNEAELSTDLNIPYSISRAVIAEAFPNLVAANIFDVGIMDQTPTRLYYEAFSGETGYEVAVTDEVETAGAEGTWYDLANKNITPGTVVVTSNPAGTDYVEGTDYVIDYELGKILPLTPGAIGANDVLVDYTYRATRKGENAAIERAKTTLSYQTIEAAADRLATYISDEAIKFSRSQIGWDAVTRTMSNLIREMRRDIDRRLMEKALMAALSVTSNSGGTWDISDSDEGDLVAKLGAAAVLVANRFYTPSFVLASVTNAERLSNWTGFQRDGFPNALLQAAGFQNMIVKGMPVFASPLFRDSNFLVGARDLVMHRVYSPLMVKGPFATYSSGQIVAAEQYYAEEYNASLAPIGGKGAVVKTQA